MELNEVGGERGYLQTWSSMRLEGRGVLTDLEINEVGGDGGTYRLGAQ